MDGMKVKRRIIALALAIIIATLSLVGCSTTESLRLAAEANKGMQAKIESLEVENEEQDRAIINALHRMGGIRAEAVREFAEKLKLITGFDDLVPTDCVMLFPYIDNLVEEMEK